MAQEMHQNNAIYQSTSDENALRRRVRSSTRSDELPIFMTRSSDEQVSAFKELRTLTCANLSDASTKLVLCHRDTFSASELNHSAISSLRFGKNIEQCGVTLHLPKLESFVSQYVSSFSSQQMLKAFTAYHEGAHCMPDNTQGRMLTVEDYLEMSTSEITSVSTYREAHADAYALLALGREMAISGNFNKYKKFLSEAADGFGTPEASKLDNPPTRLPTFKTFAMLGESLNESRLAELSDNDLQSLANTIALSGMSSLQAPSGIALDIDILNILQRGTGEEMKINTER